MTESHRQDERLRTDLRTLASEAAKGLAGPVDFWLFQPAAAFALAVEPLIARTNGPLRACLALISFIVRDVMQNLAGDIPYEPLADRLDIARANVQRSLRCCFEALEKNLRRGTDFDETLESCSDAIGEYFKTIQSLNEQAEV